MKAQANNQGEPVGTMTLKLRSCEINSFHYTGDYPFYSGDRNEMGNMTIEFKDSLEIDALIEMLHQFKETCMRAEGTWEGICRTTKEDEE